MQTIRKFFIVFCLICLPNAVWSSSSSSDLHWSKNKTIGANVSYAPDVAVNRAGDAVSAFIHSDGSHQRVQAAIRPVEEHWTTLKHFLSPAGVDAEAPKAAISPKDDDAFAIWKVHSDPQYLVQVAALDIDKENPSTPTDLTGPVDLGADPIIGVNSKGSALAVWSIFDGTSYRIQSAIHYRHRHNHRHRHRHNHHHSHKNRWIMLNDIVVNGAFELDLAFDDAGNAIIVWVGRIGFKNVIQAATLRCGSHTWVRTADASPSNMQSNSPKVGMDKKGNAIVVWSEGVTLHHIAAAKLPAGSTSWIRTSDPTADVPSGFPDVAVDSAGNAVAVWVTFAGPSVTNVGASTLAAGSLTWTTPATLASSLLITEPQVAVDRHGNAVSIWSASGLLQTAFLPFRESWTAPKTVTPPTIGVGGQRIAMTPGGFAVVTYTAQVFSSSQEIVQAIHNKP